MWWVRTKNGSLVKFDTYAKALNCFIHSHGTTIYWEPSNA